MSYQAKSENPEIVKVIVTFRCGHSIETETPSVADPAGIWADQPKCPDGTIRILEMIEDCYSCRSVEATKKWKEEQNGHCGLAEIGKANFNGRVGQRVE